MTPVTPAASLTSAASSTPDTLLTSAASAASVTPVTPAMPEAPGLPTEPPRAGGAHRTTDPGGGPRRMGEQLPERTGSGQPAARDEADDPLAAGADVWLLAERDVTAFAAVLGGIRLLSPDERARHDRLLLPAARHRFLGARLLCRGVLSQYADVAPRQWRFRIGRYGRPRVHGDATGLDFNLSHTRGLIAAVVVRGRTAGIDVEVSPARPEAVELARKVLTPLERELLHRHRGRERGLAFAETWVAKEAYTKAMGMGMCRGFDTFSVHRLRDGALAVVDDGQAPPERGRWQVRAEPLWGRFALGTAIRGAEADEGPLPVRLRSAMDELLIRHVDE